MDETLLAGVLYRPVDPARSDEAPGEFFGSPRGKARLREVLLGDDGALARLAVKRFGIDGSTREN
ncbi:MAG: hypothetical protein ABFC89_01215 [Methanospirillum sp.]